MVCYPNIFLAGLHIISFINCHKPNNNNNKTKATNLPELKQLAKPQLNFANKGITLHF